MAGEQHWDCLVIGAGISGLDVAYHLQEHCPWASYAIIERRANLGGTWDFFKYPGIRSDSDMYTFGFSWKIWKSATPIATGEEILAYLHEAAEEQGIKDKIKFGMDVSSASWCSADNRWHLEMSSGELVSCGMLFGCTGYYSYEQPHEPAFPGQARFPGQVVHPQKWTEECDKAIVGKKVAIIGSGATAVTILPNISDSAAHVTMVQRTPTYIAAKPGIDPIAQFFNNWLPSGVAVKINRWKAVLLGALFYQYCTRYPGHAKKLIRGGMFAQVKKVMSQEEFDRHFTPPYNPWEQRFCLAPDGDFFAPIREGKATMVTGHIDTFTETGIKMKGGEEVEADFIIAATGLRLQKNFPFSTMKVSIDGKEYKANEHMLYNGIMIDDVPNFGFVMGYTNASWTLKADISAIYFTKLLSYMRTNKVAKVMPLEDPKDNVVREATTGGLTSGYFARAADIMPKSGDKVPWRGGLNYLADLLRLSLGGLTTDSLQFTNNEKKDK